MASSVAANPFFRGRQWRNRPYLISPFFDFLTAGGLAIIIFAVFLLLVPATTSEISPLVIVIAIVAAYSSTFFNGSHFIASYQMIYNGYWGKLRRFRTVRMLQLRYIVAGIVVPLFFIVYFGYVLATANVYLFSTALNAMLILVGWHYAKQAFGIFIMLSSMKKIFYSALQRRLLLVNTYIVWLTYSFLVFTTDSPGLVITRTLMNLHYQPLHFFGVPAIATDLVLGLCALSFFASMIVIWQKKAPTLSGFSAYLSMYAFLLGVIVNPSWIVFIGPLHGLQYWLFVYAYKRGKAHLTPAAPARIAIQNNVRAAVFFLLSVLASVLVLEMLPNAIETWLKGGTDDFLPFAYAVSIAMNIQHYFIDNAIWRKEHSEIPKYLFYSR